MSINSNDQPAATGQHPSDPRRRQILGASALLAVGGLLWKPQPAAAEGLGRGSSLVVDVACLGNTLALNFAGGLDPEGGDFRGVSFSVEGALYPAGTILPGPGFDPDSKESIGHWLCRGWLMFHPGRPEPHGITTQEYLLEVISGDAPSPVDTLVSSGVEGGAERFTRAVIGGSGRYGRAQGQVVQETIGTNTTILNVFGAPAPTFRFHFDFA